ncbi:MAG TPA: AraC family transcriptional regulator [Xanthomonadales bacterium]|nr:AraC family transcriptional regulator [Xanthomonadales bacterium]
MIFGDEYLAEIDPGFDPDQASAEELGSLFRKAQRITRFGSSKDYSFTHQLGSTGLSGSMCFRLDEDRLIEINNSFLRKPAVIRNDVADMLSFQFVSTVKRSEFLGETKNLHELGPAIIVTAIPKPEVTYRLPKIQQYIRHVMLHTTLSNLMERMNESQKDYPVWLQEILTGECDTPRQRVLFLEDVHRDLIWSCFHLPVSGGLLKHWLVAKFNELLTIGLQILKNDPNLVNIRPAEKILPQDEKMRRAMVILNQAYAHPPSLPALAHQLGISETQLKSSFKSLSGTTVMQYCINKRIDAAKLLLNENKQSISEISDIVGYQDHSAFTRAFRRLTGASPRQWRQLRSSM